MKVVSKLSPELVQRLRINQQIGRASPAKILSLCEAPQVKNDLDHFGSVFSCVFSECYEKFSSDIEMVNGTDGNRRAHT